ncbi:iron-siderophore ABC transporter substrate-binding protein [Paenibacillus sp. y28]
MIRDGDNDFHFLHGTDEAAKALIPIREVNQQMQSFNKASAALIAAVMLCALPLSGCGTNSKPSGTADAGSTGAAASNASAASGSAQAPGTSQKTIKHVWSETKFNEAPKKIAALDYSFIDLLSVLKVVPAVTVGIGESGFPDYLRDTVKSEGIANAGQAKQPNLEVLKSARPDLIIANPDRHEMIKKQLSDIAPTIALDDHNYQEVLANLIAVGDVLGKKEQAEAVKLDIENKIKAGKDTLKSAPTVLVVGAFEDDSTVWVKTSFIGSLLSSIGANYAFDGNKDTSAAESKTDIAKLSLERLSEINPDYLFYYGDLGKWASNPIYKNLKAVKENKSIAVSRDLWSKGRGPRAAQLILDQAVKTMSANN